jgi:hypothetical protein
MSAVFASITGPQDTKTNSFCEPSVGKRACMSMMA